jgi:NAD(P)-dependent dehydrogenase (short-subunit alcohol dehydrogenase family)
MQIKDKVVIVTGGANGIGEAMARRFHADGAKAVVIADRDLDRAKRVAADIGGLAVACDVSVEADIQNLVAMAKAAYGPVDLFCSNAGIASGDPDPNNAASPSNEAWERSWGVNVMAHVYAARAVLPDWIARGEGYFLNTVSAAGLLSQIGSATYSVTKHAAIGWAENLALNHKDHGIKVSVLCPQGVDTNLLRAGPEGPQNLDGVLTPEAVAESVMHGLEAETFLILPHPMVLNYMRNKTNDYDRWIGGMAKLRRAILASRAPNP